MEDKCKLNFDLHVCHQLLNIQAKISQFLSARAKEKNKKKKTHEQGNYGTHHQRKTLNWTLYHALKIFHWKIQTKTHPQPAENNTFSSPPCNESVKCSFSRKSFPSVYIYTPPYITIHSYTSRVRFWPASEEREKRKTFFSHTYGSLGSSVWGVVRSHGVSKSSYFCCLDALQTYRRDWIRFDQNEEKFHL